MVVNNVCDAQLSASPDRVAKLVDDIEKILGQKLVGGLNSHNK